MVMIIKITVNINKIDNKDYFIILKNGRWLKSIYILS